MPKLPLFDNGISQMRVPTVRSLSPIAVTQQITKKLVNPYIKNEVTIVDPLYRGILHSGKSITLSGDGYIDVPINIELGLEELINGEFETNIDNWTPYNLSNVTQEWRDGALYLNRVEGTINGAGTYQDISLTPNKQYVIEVVIKENNFTADDSIINIITHNDHSFLKSNGVLIQLDKASEAGKAYKAIFTSQGYGDTRVYIQRDGVEVADFGIERISVKEITQNGHVVYFDFEHKKHVSPIGEIVFDKPFNEWGSFYKCHEDSGQLIVDSNGAYANYMSPDIPFGWYFVEISGNVIPDILTRRFQFHPSKDTYYFYNTPLRLYSENTTSDRVQLNNLAAGDVFDSVIIKKGANLIDETYRLEDVTFNNLVRLWDRRFTQADLDMMDDNPELLARWALGEDVGFSIGTIGPNDWYFPCTDVEGVVTTKLDPFNDGSGKALFNFENNVIDASGNYNGDWDGTTPLYSDGKFGKAVQFDGTNHVYTAKRFPLDQQFTISFWMKKLDDLSTRWLVSTREGTTGWQLAYYGNDPLEFIYYTSDGLHTLNIPSMDLAADTEFHHICITVSSDTIYAYVDGMLDASMPYTGTPLTSGVDLVSIGSTITGGFSYVGLIDQLRYFSRHLTQEEVVALYNETTPELKEIGGNNLPINGTYQRNTALSDGLQTLPFKLNSDGMPIALADANTPNFENNTDSYIDTHWIPNIREYTIKQSVLLDNGTIEHRVFSHSDAGDKYYVDGSEVTPTPLAPDLLNTLKISGKAVIGPSDNIKAVLKPFLVYNTVEQANAINKTSGTP